MAGSQADTLKAMTDNVLRIAESYKQNPQRLVELLQFSSKLYNYSFRNKMLIYAQNPNANFVASFQKWKELGAKIISGKGSSLKILKPVTATMFFSSDENTWKRLIDATSAEKQNIKAGTYETKSLLKFVPASVFDVSQTDLPKEKYSQLFRLGYSSQHHSMLVNALLNYSHSIGIPVAVSDLQSVTLRGYNTLGDNNTISLNHLLNDTEKLSVLSHEIGHGLLHHDSSIKDKPLSLIEFEADALSIMIQSHIGVEISDARKDHLATNYSKALNALESPEATKTVHTIESSLEYVSQKFNSVVSDIEHFVTQEITKEAAKDKNFISVRELPNHMFDVCCIEDSLGFIKSVFLPCSTKEEANQKLQMATSANGLYEKYEPVEYDFLKTVSNALYNNRSDLEKSFDTPYVRVPISPVSDISDNAIMTVRTAQLIFERLDKEIAMEDQSLQPINFQIVMNRENDTYEGKQLLGSGDGGLIQHIDKYWEETANNLLNQGQSQEQVAQYCIPGRQLVKDLWNTFDYNKIKECRLLRQNLLNNNNPLSEEFNQSLQKLNKQIEQGLYNIDMRNEFFSRYGHAGQTNTFPENEPYLEQKKFLYREPTFERE